MSNEILSSEVSIFLLQIRGMGLKHRYLRQNYACIVLHSEATKQLIMTDLTVPFEFNMEEHHQLKLAKYDDVAQELRSTGTIS